jgi:glycosyltransferase involved in cell wall biosynthesis
MNKTQSQPHKHHLLIIAIPFPTTRLVGSAIRVSKFIKYLLRYDWKISGFTSYFFEEDEGIHLYGLSEIVRIANPIECLRGKNLKRIFSKEPIDAPPLPSPGKIRQGLRRVAAALVVPDQFMFWVVASLYRAVKFVDKNRVEIIFSSSPSASCHLVALWIKRLRRMPWVADFRDLWVGNPIIRPKWGPFSFLEKSFQKHVVIGADLITVTTDTIANDLSQRYPEASSKIQVLPNGYDAEDISDLPSPSQVGPTIMSHVGSFYGTRSPQLLLDVLEELNLDMTYLEKRLHIRFVGFLDARQEWGLEKRKHFPQQVLAIEPLVSHRNALEIMASSHVLLLIPGADYAIPGKLYEYLAVGRPVLAIAGPNTDTSLLVSKGNYGKVIHPEDSKELSSTLRFLADSPTYNQISQYFNYSPDISLLQNFRRDVLTNQLNDLFLSKLE